MFGGTDENLVTKALKGDARSWDKLLSRYEKPIYNYALRMTQNREDAMDLMQEIFLSVYRNLENYRKEAPFRAWLYRIAGHRATDFYRRKKPTTGLAESLPTEDILGDEQANPHGDLSRRESNQLILDMLATLPLEQRQVLELKYFQDMTFEEMAKVLDVSANTLKSRLYGALRKLKELPEAAHAL